MCAIILSPWQNVLALAVRVLQDNVNLFLHCCRKHFELNDSELFDCGDLQDPAQRVFQSVSIL